MTMPRATRWAGLALSIGSLVALAACGGGPVPEDPGGDETAESVDFSQRGPITFVTGKDLSGLLQSEIDAWNKDHPDEEVRLIELPDEADQQRAQMVQNAEAQGSEYTVLSMDVVWTAEFAANGWVVPLPADQMDTSEMLPATVDGGTYFDQLYGMPVTSDGGLLFYRSDWLKAAGIDAPPTTFDEVTAACEAIKEKVSEAKEADCYGGQFNKYEGLTVNFSEFVDSSGGHLVDDDGNATANSEGAVKGLTKLKAMFDDGTIPKAAQTWSEEEGREAFQQGDLVFLRNWPYVYSKFEGEDGSSKVKGKFAVAPLPGVDGPGVSSLGGHNYAISAFAENKGTAIDFINYMANEEEMKARTEKTSQAPTRTAIYTDPELVRQYPYLPVLQQSIENARPRPKVAKYGDVTLAIQDAAYTVIQGNQDPQAALDALQAKLEELLKV
ncbi:MAG TPA: ABC transporter substrate-binding protein [Candidatus Avipropionibacterium avicola]|uniref:ABC transporter substrate-binding protein n=1 Tax=Candidatus Avipropionibacterium avicola TaxID=2840701 RepID=A0A9D1H185_9ACTN|nr:ABC transporter substrate-binding protein [Candidatus Avipropionibacterium avicola]